MSKSYRQGYQERALIESEHIPGGILVYYADGDEEILHANRYVLDLFECDTIDEFLQLTKGSFHSFVAPEDIGIIEDSIWQQVGRQNGIDHIYYRIKTKTGRLRMIDDYGRLVETDGQRPIFYVFLFEVSQTGSIDWLTGLPDMARFHKLSRLGAAALAQRGERPTAVAIDLMGMKTHNLLHGREQGDQLLRSLANVLRQQFGSEGCSRFAEDHFYAYCCETDAQDKVEAVFARYGALHEGVPIRVGIYACDPDEDIVNVGFERAKIACDLDRKTWRSHLAWYTDDMRARARMRTHILEHLGEALDKRWIRPFYQALIRSSTGEVCGEEALARWVDPHHGTLAPNVFVPVLEEAGLLYRLDMHIVDCVIEDMRTKREAGISLVPVSVNISLRDLRQLDVATEIVHRIDAAGLPHELIRIEFTESAASSDPDFFRMQVENLRRKGFEVWMDDFGSGYSSLGTLQDFDFDLIKLDMGFLRSKHVEKSHIIIASTIQMASKLGIGVLAEGVETAGQAAFLIEAGCSILQGYHYAKPAPLESVLAGTNLVTPAPRERDDELSYWTSVGLVNLNDLSMTGIGRGYEGEPFSEFPAGVIELREGTWRILRANAAAHAHLARVGVLPAGSDAVQATTVRRSLESGVPAAAARCLASGSWERVVGHLESDTGFQFYLTPIAHSASADAFMLTGVPTMLGSALGVYGDVPVAYMVFRAIYNDAADEVIDLEFVYANEQYESWIKRDTHADLVGASYLKTIEGASSSWLAYHQQAIERQTVVHDIRFAQETGHWVSVYIAPSSIEGYTICAFAIADDEQHNFNKLVVGRNTSDLVISIADALSSTASYRDAMRGLLETMSTIVHPERLYILERVGDTINNTFEWCAPGIESQMALLQGMSGNTFDSWRHLRDDDGIVVVPDTSDLRDLDKSLYDLLTSLDISRLLAVPLYEGSQAIGYLAVDNYVLDEDLDTRRLLRLVAPFITTRIANHRLMGALEDMGLHDGLTGLLNRRGIDQAVAARLAQAPQEPYVLVLMDVDNFKTVNDLHGHDVGDEALRTLARVVRESFPEPAIVGRNGGDEFLVMLAGEQSKRVDELVAALSDKRLSCTLDGKTYHLSLSIGYAGYPAQAESLQDAYTKADTALYAVKLGGKASHRRYAPHMDTQFRSQLGFTPHDIATNMPGAILVHWPGGDGKILFANDELVQMLECDDLEDFLSYTGGTYAGIIHPDDHMRVEQELNEQMDLHDIGGKDYVNFRIITKRGNVRHVANNGRLVEIEGMGKVFYELIMNRDERGVR